MAGRMHNTIVIQLFIDDDTFEWVVLDEFGEVLIGPTRGVNENLVDNIVKGSVVVVVPGADVLLTSVSIPKMSKAKTRKAIPNLLEEELVENLDDLHFAIGEYRPGKKLPIAVVSKTKMNQWLNFLSEKIPNIQGNINALVPDVLCVKRRKKKWTGVMQDDNVIVRTGKASGFVVDANNFVMFSNSLLQEQKPPEVIQLYGADGKIKNLNDLSVVVEELPLKKSLIEKFGLTVKDGVVLNLLQGEFTQQNESQLTKKLLTSAGVLVLIWLSALTLIDGVKYFVLNSKLSTLNTQISKTYKDIFPTATSVVSPRKRVERLLAEVNGDGEISEFMKLMVKVTPVVETAKGIDLQELNFANDELELKIEATDFQLLDQFVANVRNKDLTVEQSQASKSGGKIQSRITVK